YLRPDPLSPPTTYLRRPLISARPVIFASIPDFAKQILFRTDPDTTAVNARGASYDPACGQAPSEGTPRRAVGIRQDSHRSACSRGGSNSNQQFRSETPRVRLTPCPP